MLLKNNLRDKLKIFQTMPYQQSYQFLLKRRGGNKTKNKNSTEK